MTGLEAPWQIRRAGAYRFATHPARPGVQVLVTGQRGAWTGSAMRRGEATAPELGPAVEGATIDAVCEAAAAALPTQETPSN